MAMISPVRLKLSVNNSALRHIIIEPVLKKDGDESLQPTGTYKIFKDAAGDETMLFTEPKETSEPNNDLPDAMNPDYVGSFVFSNQTDWNYNGNLLGEACQREVAAYIISHNEAN